ncbi:MAG: ATP-binding protein [Gammaproteobacteria bacterium]
MNEAAREGAISGWSEVEATLAAFGTQHSLAGVLFGSDLEIVAFTDSIFDLAGMPKQTGPATLTRLMPPAARETLEREVRRVQQSGAPWQGMLASRSGRDVGARLEVAGSVAGGRDLVLATLVDMERLLAVLRQIEELNVTLQYRVSELAAMLDFAPAGIVICEDAEGRSVRPNRRAAKFFNVHIERNLSRHPSVEDPVDVLVFSDGESRSLDQYLLQRARHKRRVGDETLEMRCPDGKLLHVSIAVAPLKDRNGALRGAIGTFSDITELTRVTDQAEKRARQQAAMARLALYAVTERDISKIMKRTVEACTGTLGVKYCKILEHDRERGVLLLKAGKGWKRGRVGRATIPTRPDGSPGALAMHTRRPVVFDDFANDPRFKDRDLYMDHGIVSGASVVIEGRDGPYGALGAHADYKRPYSQDEINFIQAVAALLSTALQRQDIEEQLGESQARLTLAETDERMQRAARLASLGTLAAGIAHEINNPLNSILMNAELGQMVASDAGQASGRMQEIFARIIGDCRRCAGITSGVLQFARSDGSESKRGGDINKVMRRSIELLASILPLSELDIDLDLLEPPPPVALNETELEQAMVNLLCNAAEAGATRMRIRSVSDGDQLTISLRDNGPGIPAETFGRLFDPFFSTRREHGGTGLGLSLVHRIVLDHGGTVSARNHANGGAQFDVKLPIAWTDASED